MGYEKDLCIWLLVSFLIFKSFFADVSDTHHSIPLCDFGYTWIDYIVLFMTTGVCLVLASYNGHG